MGQILSVIWGFVFGGAKNEERPSEQNLQVSPPISDSSSFDSSIESGTHGVVIDSMIQTKEEERPIISEEVVTKEKRMEGCSNFHCIQIVEDDGQVSPPFPDLSKREPRKQAQAKEEEKKIVSKEVVKKERWIQHYSSSHKILLVGEGDFSFSASLAAAFGSATNMVPTSLDSRDVVIRNYNKAKSNLENLEKRGACLLHGVDATKMKHHTDLLTRKFDRIIFNFPHAGFHGKEDSDRVIKFHKKTVRGFFRNASGMLHANGEIHVSHKTTKPFCDWNIEELASQNALELIECVGFKKKYYPGYNNKRGAGPRCDEPFPLGACSTFKFRLSPTAKKNHQASTSRSQQFEEISIPMLPPPASSDFRYPPTNFTENVNYAPGNLGRFEEISIPMQPLLASPDFSHPPTNFTENVNDAPGYLGLPVATNVRDDCSRIFHEYFIHVEETFGRNDYDVGNSVHQALRLGFERYMTEAPGRTLNDYVDLLHELRQLSILRSAWLQRMLADPNHQP
ncbi:hypothetical protein L1049_000266 [Liquidambar formosana]|uniref:25S rRNA (uridine-N(3))-methyltransferase BMT5-like domain-containing protein n=1 Tax=Liquidambar formosana TaxID=63359 RepID=A0AAP0R590_LIQFO